VACPDGTGNYAGGEENEQGCPYPGLLVEPQVGLHEERIAEKRRQRSDIRHGVEPVRRSAAGAPGEPVLQQRTGGGQDDERRSDAEPEQEKDAANRRVRIGRPP